MWTWSELGNAFVESYGDFLNPWDGSGPPPVDWVDQVLTTGTQAGQATAVIAGAAAGGIAIAGAAGVTAGGAAAAVGTEIVDTAIEQAVSAAVGRPVIIPVSLPDIIQDGGKLICKNAVKQGVASNPAARIRLPQDIGVNSVPPAAKPLSRNVGRSETQNARAQRDAARLQRAGAQDVRINQQQVNAAGERVGINRPDLQYTNPKTGQRVNIEYERPGSTRGATHRERILANDPSARVRIRENSN